MEITFENHTPSALVLFSVDVDLFSADSMSKRERKEGVVRPGGTYSFYVPGVPSELRVKDFNTEATVHTETEGVNPVRPLYSGMWRIGHLIPGWPKPPDANTVDQRPTLVGSVIRARRHGDSPAGSVYPFVAVKRQPPFTSELSGSWIYRNFNPAFREGDETPLRERQLIVGEGVFKLETPTSTTLKGAFEWPGGFLDLLNGTVQPGAGGEPSSFEIVGTGRPDTPTVGWQYDYHGNLTRVPALVGSVIRVKPHNGRPDGWRSPAGEVFSFIAVKQ